MIKYGDKGLVQTGGIASKLFIQLYILITASMTILLGLNLLSQMLTSIGEDPFGEEEAFLLAERHLLQRTDEDRYITPEIGQYFVTNIQLFLLLFQFHYLRKQKVDFSKRKAQRNIITFHTNIKFFMFFLWIT